MQSSGLRIQLERLAREQMDIAVEQLAAAEQHALVRGARQADVDQAIEGALQRAINVMVTLLQAAPPPAKDYGARPQFIADEFIRAREKLADYRMGYLSVPRSTGSVNSLSVSITGSPGANVNQGGHHVSQVSNITINSTAALAAVTDLLQAMSTIAVDQSGRREAEADLIALKAQLERQEPNKGILQALGRSLRNVIEGTLSDCLAEAATKAATQLWNALSI